MAGEPLRERLCGLLLLPPFGVQQACLLNLVVALFLDQTARKVFLLLEKALPLAFLPFVPALQLGQLFLVVALLPSVLRQSLLEFALGLRCTLFKRRLGFFELALFLELLLFREMTVLLRFEPRGNGFFVALALFGDLARHFFSAYLGHDFFLLLLEVLGCLPRNLLPLGGELGFAGLFACDAAFPRLLLERDRFFAFLIQTQPLRLQPLFKLAREPFALGRQRHTFSRLQRCLQVLFPAFFFGDPRTLLLVVAQGSQMLFQPRGMLACQLLLVGGRFVL
mmetsp:Transcript_7461/g.18019  ORF Transcript_7461/g.18019 Transcript_7461/m.18019 type:complete len:280 (+) Transcript_7461:3002-3841(+)